MTINYAFLTDTHNHTIVDKARANGIELMAELPRLCFRCLQLNKQHPGRYTVNIAAATIFKNGQAPQSAVELYAYMHTQ